MPVKPHLWVLSTLFAVGAPMPTVAQTAYKCWSRGAVTYSQKPCAGRVISTQDAPVPPMRNPKEVDVRRLEQNRVLARSLRQKDGETTEQFETRRRRTRLLVHDRQECERLDKRMPVEAASLTNPDPEEVSKAQAALRESRKRFDQLRC
jgi:hypothetical protein